MFNTTFGKKHFTEKITKLYKENVFNGEIKMQQEKELQSPSVGATTIEEIEYYLNILKKNNSNSYDTLNQEFQDILNDKNKQSLAYLGYFLGRILATITLDEKLDNTISLYLSNIKDEYLKKIENCDFESKFSIKDIDNLVELFLKQKDNYDILEERKILKNFAYIYLFEIYFQKNLTEKDLENSYVKNILKTIIVVIFQLEEEGIIKKITSETFKSLDLNTIINIIRKIEFANIKVKKYK